MKYLAYIPVFIVLLIVQLTLMPVISVWSLVPDAILLGVIYLGLREGGIPAMIAGCFVGFARDAFSTGLMGASMLGLVVAGFLAGIFAQNGARFGTQSKLVFLFLIVLVYHVIYFTLHFLGASLTPVTLILRYALPAVLYTLVIAGIAFYGLPARFRRLR